MPIVECEDLSKWYGDVIAVNDLGVSLEPGVTGLLGPNGAGKTTLMRLMMGLLQPSAGVLRVLDEDPWDNPALLGRIGYVPDGQPPWRDRSGLACATLAGRLSGLAPIEAEEAAGSALARVGLSEAQNRKVDGYSRGMKQRLKFALALLRDPELLILDEPLLGTDPLTRRDLIDLMRGMAADGKSVILSTHVLPDVESMTDRILLLNHGRILAHGQVSEIRDLLEQYPRTVRVSTPEPRAVGAALWELESVLSLEAGDGALTVLTRDPQTFFGDVQALLVKTDLPFTGIETVDDNVEAVFRYLVGGASS